MNTAADWQDGNTAGASYDMSRQILAFLYSDGLAADRLLADVGYKLRAAGVNVAGLVQRNTVVRGRAKCDMELEELGSGTVVRIWEDRGALAKGCRLDQNVLTQASHLMMGIVAQRPAVLIVNKFGKVEAEGGGLRDVIAAAAQSDIPTLVGVPFRNIDQWRAFADGLADEVRSGADVVAWLKTVGFGVEIDLDRNGENAYWGQPQAVPSSQASLIGERS